MDVPVAKLERSVDSSATGSAVLGYMLGARPVKSRLGAGRESGRDAGRELAEMPVEVQTLR